jgi:hypothetical protein
MTIIPIFCNCCLILQAVTSLNTCFLLTSLNVWIWTLNLMTIIPIFWNCCLILQAVTSLNTCFSVTSLNDLPKTQSLQIPVPSSIRGYNLRHMGQIRSACSGYILSIGTMIMQRCGSRSQWPAAWSKEWTVFDRSNTGIVGSNSTRDMDACVRLFCVCVALCVASGFATGWSPVHGVLPTVYRIKKLKKKRPRYKGL